jgi:hypothetical protein
MVKLIDKAEYTCACNLSTEDAGDTQKEPLKYQLAFVHTLTDGYPWHRNNKKKLEQIKTSDYPFEIFMNIFMKYCIKTNKYKYFNNKEIIHDLNRFIEAYTNNKNKCITEFFTEATMKSCSIISIIYSDIYRLLNLETYYHPEMIIKLV